VKESPMDDDARRDATMAVAIVLLIAPERL
jgi:hypothetical protein